MGEEKNLGALYLIRNTALNNKPRKMHTIWQWKTLSADTKKTQFYWSKNTVTTFLCPFYEGVTQLAHVHVVAVYKTTNWNESVQKT